MTLSVLRSRALATSLIASILLGAAGTACAESASAPKTKDLPPVLQEAVKAGQFKVTKQFDTDAPGITGYVVEQNGQHRIVYGDDGYLIMGRLISPEGENLSAQYTDQYVPKPDVSKVVDQLEAAGHLVQQGPDDAPVLYVFADPNCIYCHRFYQQVKPMVDAGQLQIQWVMVGFLKDSSMGRAAAILSADEPAKALVENENGFEEDSENGGIEPLDSPSQKLRDVIDEHYKQMSAAGGSGTPTVLYKKQGDQWAARVGVPPKPWLKQYIDSHS